MTADIAGGLTPSAAQAGFDQLGDGLHRRQPIPPQSLEGDRQRRPTAQSGEKSRPAQAAAGIEARLDLGRQVGLGGIADPPHDPPPQAPR